MLSRKHQSIPNTETLCAVFERVYSVSLFSFAQRSKIKQANFSAEKVDCQKSADLIKQAITYLEFLISMFFSDRKAKSSCFLDSAKISRYPDNISQEMPDMLSYIFVLVV